MGRAASSAMFGPRGDEPAFEAWRGWPHGEKDLIDAAILAASAHNTQPWLFRHEEDGWSLFADPSRHIGAFDPFRRELHQSLGCALANLELAALASRCGVHVELPPGSLELDAVPPGPSAIVRLGSLHTLPAHVVELYRAIPLRHTNRGAYDGEPMRPETLHELVALAAEERHVSLTLLEGEAMAELARSIVSATRAIIDDTAMWEDNARWFRFHEEEVARHRDGLTLDANVAAPVPNFMAHLFPPSPRRAGRHWLHDTEHVELRTASVLGILSVREPYDRPTALLVGRLRQRIHLLLTARGCDGQPLNQPIELMDRDRELGRAPGAYEDLAGFVTPDWTPAFIFRAGVGVRPAAWSPRRPVPDVLTS